VILLHRNGLWEAVDRRDRAAFEARGIGIDDAALIGDGVRIGRGAGIGRGAIVGDGAVIGRFSLIGDMAIVGACAVIGPGARIGGMCVVPHGTVIDRREKPPCIMIAGSAWPLLYLGRDQVDIGCRRAALDEWLSGEGEADARARGFTAGQVREYRIYLEALKEIHEKLYDTTKI
jgi:NDP-sugar pyrophosphorylase family protein